MGDCIHSDFNGNCQVFDDNIEMLGCDENGVCICQDDPDPLLTCENYEGE